MSLQQYGKFNETPYSRLDELQGQPIHWHAHNICNTPNRNGTRSSVLTATLREGRNTSFENQELRSILAVCGEEHSNLYEGASLGISPPCRTGAFGGAANPIVNNALWTKTACDASLDCLQVLRELEASGSSFLQGDILIGSPMKDSVSVMQQQIQQQQQPKQEGRSMTSKCSPCQPFQCSVEYFAVRSV